MLGSVLQKNRLRRNAGSISALIGALVMAFVVAGCGPKGQGEACDFHRDCADGLVCDASTNTCNACGDGSACLGVDLVVQSCVSEQSPFIRENGLVLRVVVTGDDLNPIVAYETPGGGLDLPEIPLGTNRQLTVEAFKGTPDNVVARGSSMPFDVTPRGALPKLGINLRMVNEFTPMNDLENPTGPCEALFLPRAGHTATVLSDGRVLVVGGHNYDANGNRVFQKDVEILDPNVGHFHEGAPLNVPRSGHTATLLEDGRVLVTGGVGLINGQPTPLRIAEVWDPSRNTWDVHQMNLPRARHAALRLSDGRVLLAGGVGSALGRAASSTTEIFFPNKRPEDSFAMGPEIAARADHAMVALGDSRVVLVGGVNGDDEALDTTTTLRVAGDSIFAESSSPTLSTPRKSPVAFPINIGGSLGILVPGGEGEADWITISGESLAVESRQVDGTTVREGACAAPFDGGALVVGGKDQGGAALSNAEVYRRGSDGSLLSSGAGNSLRTGRFNASCTTLADGSVLVLGGESLREGQPQASGLAEVYQPEAAATPVGFFQAD